ncbi:hypothetical protein I533_04135 [Alteromonas mediterranea MED64]|mgnify:FL=1|nr:hypothetical protein I533_04135 [Alteromonas mediterranea MED64]AGP84639.1 hypothetical protein I607_04155 [Alteromonas mediterranea U4]AGP88754.1 hypothetical protein I876_04365 [Alteromonas mediterranea U7]AGP92637.1 hypothetical protein I634_04515 [Alteromonas mediterranea U8]
MLQGSFATFGYLGAASLLEKAGINEHRAQRRIIIGKRAVANTVIKKGCP